jgi:hypothetical protein
VQVVVPDVLTPSGFVVLAEHDAVTLVNRFERQSQAFGKAVQRAEHLVRHNVEVFIRHVGNDERVAASFLIASCGDKRRQLCVAVEDVALLGERSSPWISPETDFGTPAARA